MSDFRPFSDYDILQARGDGEVARFDEYELWDNPYDRHTLQWEAWREGWQQADDALAQQAGKEKS